MSYMCSILIDFLYCHGKYRCINWLPVYYHSINTSVFFCRLIWQKNCDLIKPLISYIKVDNLALFSIKGLLDMFKITLEQQHLYVLSFLHMNNYLLGTTLPHLRLITRPSSKNLAKAEGNYDQFRFYCWNLYLVYKIYRNTWKKLFYWQYIGTRN